MLDGVLPGTQPDDIDNAFVIPACRVHWITFMCPLFIGSLQVRLPAIKQFGTALSPFPAD